MKRPRHICRSALWRSALTIGQTTATRNRHYPCVDRAAILAVPALALLVVGACGDDDPAATSTASVATVSQDKDDGSS
jgi:hypothetical protein